MGEAAGGKYWSGEAGVGKRGTGSIKRHPCFVYFFLKMKGVLYLLRFLPKDIVQKIHRYIVLKEKFLIPLKYKLNTHDVFISGRLSHKTGSLRIRSIFLTKKGRHTSLVDIAFWVTNEGFKTWLHYWENIMHAYYQEKGIQKERCNILRNNTLFYRTKEDTYYGDSDVDRSSWDNGKKCKATKWNQFVVGKTVEMGVLYILGVGWKHNQAKMKISLGF